MGSTPIAQNADEVLTMRWPIPRTSSQRITLGIEQLEDRTQPSVLNLAVQDLSLFDAGPGRGHSDTFIPPGHAAGHPGLAAGITEFIELIPPGLASGSFSGLLVPLAAAQAGHSEVVIVIFPGVGDNPSPPDFGNGDGSKSGSGNGSGSQTDSGNGAGQSGAAGGSDSSSTNSSSSGRVSNSSAGRASTAALGPVGAGTSEQAAASVTGAAALPVAEVAALLPPDPNTPAPTPTIVTPTIDRNALSLAAFVDVGRGDGPSVLPTFLTTGSVGAVAVTDRPVAPEPRLAPDHDGINPAPVEPAPLPRLVGPSDEATGAATNPAVLSLPADDAGQTYAAAVAELDSVVPAPVEAGNSVWAWVGGAAATVAALGYWLTRHYRLGWKADALFRKKLAALPLGTVLSTDLD